jgi:hypothetical protein
MVESERQKAPPVTTAPTPEQTWVMEQRRQEYKMVPFIAPVVSIGVKSVEAERAAEEAKIRDAYEAQIKAQEDAARAKFEADVASQKSQAKQSGIAEADVTSWEKETRATFETQVSQYRQEQIAALEPQLATWRETWQTAGLAERMMEIKVPSLDIGGKLAEVFGVKPISREGLVAMKPHKPEVTPLVGFAGMVASVESFVYGVGELVGLKTPKIPTTLTGGLITSGIESVGKGQLTASRELKALAKMPSEYAAGTLIGDILVSYGISKAVGVGAKAIKGAAGFIYEESGLKYSHALYEAKQTLLGIEEALPKSPIAAIKESDLAMKVSEGLSSLKHAILPTKLMEVPAEGIVLLPTLEEEISMEGVSAFKEGAKMSKALETATAIGVTPLEYGEAVYPKAFAGMELMGWTDAPKTAAFGLTVPKAIPEVVSPLAEALRETIGILPSAAEKWAVRAGVIPSPEEVIVQSPKELTEQMIKGGRVLDIPKAADILGFEKFPYKEAATGKFFFEKEKLPTLKDLLKETKGEMALTHLMEVPAQIIEPFLPKLALLPEVAGKVSVADAIGLGAMLGIRAMEKERLKPKPLEKLSPLAALILKPSVKVTPAEKVRLKQVPLESQILAPAHAQALETMQIAKQIFKPLTIQTLKPPPSIIPKIPRKKEEPLARIKRADIFGEKPKKKMAGYLYPVLPEKKLPAYIKIGLGKTKKLKSATSFILGKGKKHVLQKTRHKRK